MKSQSKRKGEHYICLLFFSLLLLYAVLYNTSHRKRATCGYMQEHYYVDAPLSSAFVPLFSSLTKRKVLTAIPSWKCFFAVTNWFVFPISTLTTKTLKDENVKKDEDMWEKQERYITFLSVSLLDLFSPVSVELSSSLSFLRLAADSPCAFERKVSDRGILFFAFPRSSPLSSDIYFKFRYRCRNNGHTHTSGIPGYMFIQSDINYTVAAWCSVGRPSLSRVASFPFRPNYAQLYS